MKNPCDYPACCGRPSPDARGGFLMQRILACGKLHRRPECVYLPPERLPRGVQPPIRVLEAAVCGLPSWQELPRCCRSGLPLLVDVPVALCVQDECGKSFSLDVTLEAELTLRRLCPESESWRGQVFLQSAVRPWKGCLPRQGNGWEVPLEWLVEGYLLLPCAMGGAIPPACFDPRPLYPQPRFDPGWDNTII